MNKKEVIVNEVKDGNKIEITKTKEGAYEIIVSHAFKTTTEITERTVKISDIFGLCIDSELRFPIYEDFRIELEFPTVVYLTGDSGSGKSWLLNNVFSRLDNSISLNDIKIDPNEIVIEGVGKNLDDALKKLSIAGLGDAFIYGRRFCELSDGQKFRYRICKLIDSDKDIWLIDEFASTLDRVTAKVVAFGLQKLARRLKKILIVATAHKDLRLELQADWFLDKGYGSDVYDECAMGFNEEYADQEKSEIFKHIEIGHGTMDDYKKLSQFHYRQKSLPAVKEIWKLTYYDDIEKETHLAGVMVISYPPLALKGRNIATNNEYAKMSKETCDRLNKDVATILVIVVSDWHHFL
ncbi:MAG: hypothetical protein NTZ95_03415 [Candidatus Omnitrophica bacterium]|nr:hypothetical protein [Candidatus Omnitrophota bacterium]